MILTGQKNVALCCYEWDWVFRGASKKYGAPYGANKLSLENLHESGFVVAGEGLNVQPSPLQITCNTRIKVLVNYKNTKIWFKFSQTTIKSLTPSSTTASSRSRAAVCWIGRDSRYGPSHQESNTGPGGDEDDDDMDPTTKTKSETQGMWQQCLKTLETSLVPDWTKVCNLFSALAGNLQETEKYLCSIVPRQI